MSAGALIKLKDRQNSLWDWDCCSINSIKRLEQFFFYRREKGLRDQFSLSSLRLSGCMKVLRIWLPSALFVTFVVSALSNAFQHVFQNRRELSSWLSNSGTRPSHAMRKGIICQSKRMLRPQHYLKTLKRMSTSVIFNSVVKFVQKNKVAKRIALLFMGQFLALWLIMKFKPTKEDERVSESHLFVAYALE